MNTYNTNGRASAQSGESAVATPFLTRSPRLASFTLSGATLGSLMLLAPTALAAEASSDALETVQVTANRIPQLQNDVLASTEVITRDEIDRLQASSLVDLLQSRNGIEIARTGPMGNQTSLFMRGTESDHTLVLVNGQRVANSADGLARFEFLPLSAIERVEIVRGPRASVYGADAIGGVINLITRGGTTPGQHAEVTVRAGSDGTFRQNAQFSTVEDDTRLSANIHHAESDGFSARDTGSEDDGFEATGAELRLSHDFSQRATLSLGIANTETDYDYDDCNFGTSEDCTGEGSQLVLDGSLLTHLNPNWDMTVSVARTRDEYENTEAGSDAGRVASARNEVGVRHDFYTKVGTLSLGIDHREESLDADGPFFIAGGYEVDSRYATGIYGNWQVQQQRHHLNTSIRYDDDNRYGHQVTGGTSYAFDLTDAQQIGASYASAFKAPNLIDLYSPYGSGNPDLDAETSTTGEIFWRLQQQHWHVGVNAFQTDIDDLISYEGPDFTPINIDRSRIRGVELSSGWKGEALSVNLAMTWQDPEDRDTGKQLKRRAQRFARLDADYALNDWNFGATLRGSASRSDTDADTFSDTRTAGYGVFDLRTNWQVMPNVKLSAKLDNVFDRDYQLVNGYNTQGRYFEGGVTLSF
ncbi:TonB-dependent receptor domain-containing protein [Cobetia crustatorum]|uniref:TonB-dependent receptor n=1 Tax=Cobetia crustatorum TaxID=553385 RepID=A0A558HXQ1_9GAMM|nr:TonB-dependent receptor [Cobetia crustatorum]TVU73864.1 TonB-dependent receptor [Cobetia crustatorum]